MKSKTILSIVLSVAMVLTMTFGLSPTIAFASGTDYNVPACQDTKSDLLR